MKKFFFLMLTIVGMVACSQPGTIISHSANLTVFEDDAGLLVVEAHGDHDSIDLVVTTFEDGNAIMMNAFTLVCRDGICTCGKCDYGRQSFNKLEYTTSFEIRKDGEVLDEYVYRPLSSKADLSLKKT